MYFIVKNFVKKGMNCNNFKAVIHVLTKAEWDFMQSLQHGCEISMYIFALLRVYFIGSKHQLINIYLPSKKEEL